MLEVYHPVWIIVKMYPEMIAFVHGCKKHFVTFVLLNDTFIIVIHEIGKAILCLLRDWCDKCCLHDNLVEMCVI